MKAYNPLKNKNGITLIELMMVIAVISTLATISLVNYFPVRQRSMDAAALSDASTILKTVVDATMVDADIDFTKNNTGGSVGALDTSGNPRTPVFTLSPGVAALITGSSGLGPNGNNTVFSALIYHTGGTVDTFTQSGRKEYSCFIDANSGVITAPTQ